MKHIELFDLDGTVIDSSIRVVPCLRANGDLDLEKYIAEACTEEAVNTDTLLPLADYMKQCIAKGDTIAIVTARYMHNHDYVYLRKQGLLKGRKVIVCSRDQLANVFGKERGAEISAMSDGEYKRQWFQYLWHCFPMASFTMYDDHKGVLAVAQEMGIRAIDATVINKILNDTFAAGMQCAYDEDEWLIDSLIEDTLLAYQQEIDNCYLENC